LQQQKQQLLQQSLKLESKPKFTALQNIEKLFKDKPVVTHEKHRIRLEDIAKINYEEEEKSNPGHLFK
jgi:multidrug efflux pump subunit AcrB